MAISIVGAKTAPVAAPSTITPPAGVTPGDLLVVMEGGDVTNGTPPSGWTRLRSAAVVDSVGPSDSYQSGFIRWADGSSLDVFNAVGMSTYLSRLVEIALRGVDPSGGVLLADEGTLGNRTMPTTTLPVSGGAEILLYGAWGASNDTGAITGAWTSDLFEDYGQQGWFTARHNLIAGGGVAGGQTLRAPNIGAVYGTVYSYLVVKRYIPPAPPAPTQVAPADRLALAARSGITFQFAHIGQEITGWSLRRRKWNVNAADGSGLAYEYWNAATSAWVSGVVVNAGAATSVFSQSIDWDADDTTYFWSVRSTNPGGDGTWSAERIFNPWEWWNGTSWQSTETDVANAAGSITIPGGVYANGAYEWSVGTKDATDWGPYSQEIPFIVGAANARSSWGGVGI